MGDIVGWEMKGLAILDVNTGMCRSTGALRGKTTWGFLGPNHSPLDAKMWYSASVFR